jgi:hypothetical protein
MGTSRSGETHHIVVNYYLYTMYGVLMNQTNKRKNALSGVPFRFPGFISAISGVFAGFSERNLTRLNRPKK